MCKLVRQDDGSFRAPAGSTITVDIRSDRPASTVQIAYAGEQDGAAPFQFKVKSGRNALLVVALGVDTVQQMTVVEVDGATDCKLRRFSWSTARFFTVLVIEGR